MHRISCTTTIILVGGLGTRLRAMVADRPKVLAEVHGRPFLAYLLDQVAAAGVQDVVLCTGYLGAQIQSCFGGSYKGMRLAYSQEPSPLGTAGALRLTMPLLRSDPVLVMNGDSYCKVDFQPFVTWHFERRANATLLLTEVPDTRRYGRVEVDADGQIRRFEEKGGQGRSGWINAGIYVLSQQVLLTIPEHQAVSLERDIFPAQIGRGLYGYQRAGEFLDIGTPESYAEAERFFEKPQMDTTSKVAPISKMCS
jgi:D-glycero-alpha-D-manno-heptose 1-phosphate guanylyltransferase